ncbi:MAG: deoxyribonuclease IV [Candidatus Spechtbacterales bacterium]|nr:deoxyribonuclease IV [Candidatus Spechtbacterales bacterium]
MNQETLVGAHVPTRGSLKSSITYAESIGAEAIQIFGSSPMRWSVTTRSKKDVDDFKKELAKSKISQVFLHAPYLVNLAGSNKSILKKSLVALKSHLNIAERVGAVGIVVHLGSSGKNDIRDKKDVLEQISGAVNQILKESPGDTFFIMENTAGAGATFGINQNELSAIADKVKSPRLKVCIDTAHAYGSGILEYKNSKEVDKFFDSWEDAMGKNGIAVIHANDSKVKYLSRKDRHENIGEGHIGIKGFEVLAKNKKARSVPWVLEVPGFANNGPDSDNIKIIKKILNNA